MELIYGKGIFGIEFGMKYADVKKVLGKPDKIIDCEGSTVYVYNKQMIQIWFDCERDFRVTLIQVLNPDIKLEGNQVFLKKKEKLQEIFSKYKSTPENVYDFQETLFYKEIGLWLNFQFNKLFSFELGVLYDDKDKEIW